MILEADEETRDFVTVYTKDFYPKKTKKLDKFIQPLNFDPPFTALNGPFKEHLNSLRKNEKVPPNEKTEDIRENLQKLRSKYRHLEKSLPLKPPDENVIEANQKKAYRTMYQLEYSRDLDDYLSLHAKRTGGDRSPVRLPEKWIIPETIHKISFRNPAGISGSSKRSHRIRKPTNHLDPNEGEREILRVATGNSEYCDVIGATGDRIFREQLNYISIPEDISHLERPDSLRSDCSKILMPRKQDQNISAIF